MKYLAFLLTAFLGSSVAHFSSKNNTNSLVFAEKPSLAGQVSDAETGAKLVGATVVAFQKEEKMGSATTDSAGNFQLENLAAGSFSVQISLVGYEAKRVTGVKIEADKTTRLDVSLKNGAILEEVVVVGYNPLKNDATKSEGILDDKMVYATGAASESVVKKDEAVGVGRMYETPPPSPAKYESAKRAAAPKSKAKPAAPTETKPEMLLKTTISDKERADFSEKETDKMAVAPAGQPAPRAGLLTAGEWNDLNNWAKHWTDLLADGELKPFETQWNFWPKNRYTFLLTNKNDFPLVDATVKMFDETGALVWETRTDNTGKAECWAGLFDEKMPKLLVSQVIFNGNVKNLGQPKPFSEGMNRHSFDFECGAPKNLDIVFAVDATGSMGDEIQYLQTELTDVLNRVQAANPSVSLRTGSVFYRDATDEYVVKSSGLTANLSKTVEYINQQSADGGGDWPEAVHSALDEAVFHQNWSKEAVARICFLVLDASPHNEAEVKKSLQNSIRAAAAKGIRLVPVVASGIQKETEWLMKFMDLATNGSYVFLTDHSGIGGHHLEPTTDEYKVESLNDLLVRLITEFSTVENCDGKSEIRFKNDNSNQQNEQHETQKVFFYPNPASTQFTMELPFDVETITLYDAEGKAVKKLTNQKTGPISISVSDLADGFYTIRILKGNQWQSGKILVVRS